MNVLLIDLGGRDLIQIANRLGIATFDAIVLIISLKLFNFLLASYTSLVLGLKLG